jgi:predicted nucleic acid-binding protein
MRYLLDVNALIAFGIVQHQFHERVVHWVASQRGSAFLTTPITEIGFVRVVASVPSYQLGVSEARNLLVEIKLNLAKPLEFVPDNADISSMPNWVRTPAHVTDGHLIRVAANHKAVLATLDERIPDSLLIPQ